MKTDVFKFSDEVIGDSRRLKDDVDIERSLRIEVGTQDLAAGFRNARSESSAAVLPR